VLTHSNTNPSDPSRSSYYVDDAFYQDLIDGQAEWYQTGTTVDDSVQKQCEVLLFREARLLDDGQLDEWLTLFAPECLYWIPNVPGGGDPRREVAIAFDDRRRLEDRVYWLQCGYAYSQTPRSRTSHLISNIEVFQGTTAETLRIRSNFVLHEFRQGETRSFAGWCGHRLRWMEDEWKITLKQVNLIDCDRGHENLTFSI
jgi:3-phenylpropionate/cinnamic acid dioxygenase small subunit